MAKTYKVAVCKCKLWFVPQMSDMMHRHRPYISSFLSAHLARVVITSQDLGAFLFPLCRMIKGLPSSIRFSRDLSYPFPNLPLLIRVIVQSYSFPFVLSFSRILPTISNPASPAISRSMCTTFITGSGVRSACFTASSAVGSLYRSPFIFSPSIIARLYHRNTKQHSTRPDQQPDNKTNHSLSLTFAHEKGQPEDCPSLLLLVLFNKLLH